MIYMESKSSTSATAWNYGMTKWSIVDDYGSISDDYVCYTGNTTTSVIDNYNKETAINVTNYWRDDYHNSWVCGGISRVKTPQERLREMIQSRQAPAIHCSRRALNPVVNIEEMRARDMLRRVIGSDKFRDFMRNGFVSVQAKSGKMYQIFPGQDITNVFLNGEKIERLCVVLRGKFPPTDSLIMRYLLILNDEQDFRSYAIQHKVYPSAMVRVTLPAEPLKSLPELFRGLKVA